MGNALSFLFKSSSNNNSSSTASLLDACMENNVDLVKRLVGRHAASYTTHQVGRDVQLPDDTLQSYVNSANHEGNAAIHAAAFVGNLSLVRFLVQDCGASVWIKNGLGCFPLWLAAGYNRVDVLEYLISLDSDRITETNNSGDSALLAAASRGNTECCRVLLASSSIADGEEMLVLKNKNGDTPLSVAVAGGHCCNDTVLMDMLLIPKYSNDLLNHPNRQGLTPLLVACERDWYNVCKNLLDRGASMSIPDTTGATVLHVAAFCGSKSVIPLFVNLLNVPNKNGCTPLWLAARTGNCDVCRILLEAGANTDIANKDGLTPLQVAEKYQKQDVIKVLEKYKHLEMR